MMSMVLPSDLRHKTVPDELVVEILSHLNVKSLMQLKCVSKSWNSIISDSFFVKMHLDKSSRNPHMMLFSSHNINNSPCVSLRIFPIRCLRENQSINIFREESKHQLMKWRHPCRVIGSFNGLVCFHYSSDQQPLENEFYLWNPATTPFSENLGSFRLRFRHPKHFFRFSFGYDKLTNKYKLLAFSSKEVRVFTFGDNIWNNMQCFPVDPYYSGDNSNGVYLSNSLNWFALLDNNGFYRNDLNVEQFVIISLDLGTETYTQFPFPREFDEVPSLPPIVCVLMDCLCFCHYTQEHCFVIWQMTEFGVEKSWTKLLKLDYHRYDCFALFEFSRRVNLLPLPLHVFENGDILILLRKARQLILYNRRDNIVVRKIYTSNIYLSSVVPYVESLVSTF